MKSFAKRLFLTTLLYLGIFEVLSQLGVGWKESTSERWEILLILAVFASSFWVVRPLFARLVKVATQRCGC